MDYLISNIQRFSLHDGPGIRTTVFFKGCMIHCPWCANPENISFDNDFYIDDNGKKEYWGQYYSVEELKGILEKDIKFYGEDGGVTFSGGEPLCALGKNIRIISVLKQAGINIAIETSLFVPTKYLKNVLSQIDYVFIDLKILSEDKCKSILGGDACLFKKNIHYVSEEIPWISPVFRMPLVRGINTERDCLDEVIAILSKFSKPKIQIFNIHNLAQKKYQYLRITPSIFEPLSDAEIEEIKTYLHNNGAEVEIIVM